MRPEKIKYLNDVLDCIFWINDYFEGDLTLSHFNRSRKLRRAVERELEIIAEALKKFHRFGPKIEIESFRQIVGLRNRIIHEYDEVDDEIVFMIVQHYLPQLHAEVSLLLES